MESTQPQLRWRLGVLAGVAMLLLSLYPQINLWMLRGKDWNGAYAYNDIDEVAYAAYVKALIDGRPRRNDPYTGRDHSSIAPQPESLFSIQFIPPAVLALLARPFGLSASTMMTLCGAFAAFATALVLFWFLRLLTDDPRLAAAGALTVLCLGTLACAQGAIIQLTGRGWAYPYLPFLRRYIPALPFPIFFLFCGLIWRSITSERAKTVSLYAVGAGLSLSVLVYSYFYLWTSALAWLVCFAALVLISRPEGWRRIGKPLGIVGAIFVVALVPYWLLLSNRATTMDAVQLLTFSRSPDLMRPPTLTGLFVLAVILASVSRGKLRWRNPSTLLAAAFALTPLVVFNQQILTGRSLQPIHYEVFIINYVATFSAVLVGAQLWSTTRLSERRKLASRLLAFIAVVVFAWGVVEADVSTHVLDEQNVIRDEAVPVGLRLTELAGESAREGRGKHEVVFSPNLIQGDDLATLAPQAVLWARHLHIFSSTTWEESKERFYQHAYYAGLDAQWLERELTNGNFVVVIALFGWGRNHDRLTVNPQTLTAEEIRAEADRFSNYIATFDRERASHPMLSYVVIDADGAFDFSNLDRWYDRDAGERVGKFMLYRVRLR